MPSPATLIGGVIILTIAAFLSGRWRHDIVAVGALLSCIALGLVSPATAFSGFAHPAVITVAGVLMLSRILETSGAIDLLLVRLLPGNAGPLVSLFALTTTAAAISAFMNNVGALALLMPVTLQVASRLELPPGQLLMPVAFASILGGMTTLIGTPPNLIVSGFRSQYAGSGFAMFDFSAVGIAIALTGIAFILLIGWRLVPSRERRNVEGFDSGKYLTEIRVTEHSQLRGQRVGEMEPLLEEYDAQLIGLARHHLHVTAPRPRFVLRQDDILVIEVDPESLPKLLGRLGLALEESVPTDAEPQAETEAETKTAPPSADADEEKAEEPAPTEEEPTLIEMTVRPDSSLIGRSATHLSLRTRYGLNLLAISRQGRQSIKRLRSTTLQAGDVLLMQGRPEALNGFAAEYQCIPLAERDIHLPERTHAWWSAGVMALAVGAAASGLLPAAVAFIAAIFVLIVLRIATLRTLYDAVDWPVIVLLGALVPVSGALVDSGAAQLISHWLAATLADGNAVLALLAILVLTMTLSDFMNNAATALVMCPIAVSLAKTLDANPDTFLMAVAIGASCAFLTPIGHQNNTLIMGPGGFRFGDYWRLGLPIELIVVAVGMPMLLLFWPLFPQ